MKLSGFKIDGNPIKLIKRTVIEKGTVAILEYLRTKHTGPVPELQEKPVAQDKMEEQYDEPEDNYKQEIKLNHPQRNVQPQTQQPKQ